MNEGTANHLATIERGQGVTKDRWTARSQPRDLSAEGGAPRWRACFAPHLCGPDSRCSLCGTHLSALQQATRHRFGRSTWMGVEETHMNRSWKERNERKKNKPHLFVFIPQHRVHDRDLVVAVVPAIVMEVKVEVPHAGVVQQRDVATEH